MNEARLARKHTLWLKQGHQYLDQQFQSLEHYGRLCIDRQLLMLATLEPHLLECVRQRVQPLPAGMTHDLRFYFSPWDDESDCRTPPPNEALLATARELVLIMNRFEPLKRFIWATHRLTLYHQSWRGIQVLNRCFFDVVLW